MQADHNVAMYDAPGSKLDRMFFMISSVPTSKNWDIILKQSMNTFRHIPNPFLIIMSFPIRRSRIDFADKT
jgi:hypothetical protein